jgi:hypothetical protein
MAEARAHFGSAEKPFPPEPPLQFDRRPVAPAKEPAMPSKPPVPKRERTCGACHEKGHRADHCPTTTPAPKTCGYCKRTGGTHAEFCKSLRARQARKDASKPVPPPVAPSNAANRAKAAASALLTELRAVRAQLDARIKTVEELEGIL